MAEPSRWTFDHRFEVFGRRLRKAGIAQNAGIVDEHIGTAPLRDGLSNHVIDLGDIGDVCAMRHRFTARRLNLRDDLFGGFGGTTRAIRSAAKIVDDDFGTALRELERMRSAQAITSAGHNHHAIIETNCHVFPTPDLFLFLEDQPTI